MTNSTTSTSGPGVGGQALLKRRVGSSVEDFQRHYIDRHAPIAIPWCFANGVTYYAQIHRPLRWASRDLEVKYTELGIDLEEWDAVAAMVFPPIVTIEDYYRSKVGKTYHLQVINPDERRFLLSEALMHLQGLEPGAATGERVEIIVDGKPMVDVGKWQTVFDEVEAGVHSDRGKLDVV